MTTAQPRMTSYFSKETMISVLVPEGWTGQVVNESQFRIFGPHEVAFDHYRSTMSYQRTDVKGDGEEWLEGLIAQSGEKLRLDSPGFQLVREQRFMLSCLAKVYVRWYRWRDEDTGLRFSQLQSLIVAEDGTLYIVNAATLEPIEERYWPTFEAILKSTRVIPPEGQAHDVGALGETAAAFFQMDGWSFSFDREQNVIRTSFQGDSGQWNCYAQVREALEQFVFYSVCPMNVPEDKRGAVAEFLTRANYGLTVGNFEMNYGDGEVRFKTSIDVEGDRLSTALVRQLVYSNVTMVDTYLPGIMSVIYGGVSPAEAIAEREG
jgi:hypothetical protein